MNPESFSSLPEGQWLLQQVQIKFCDYKRLSRTAPLTNSWTALPFSAPSGKPLDIHRSFGSVSRSFSSTPSIRGNAGCCRFSV